MLRSLRDVAFESDPDGEICYNAGNSAVVLRVLWRGERYALRCYRRHHPYLREIYGESYYPEELEVGDELLDVVLVPWVEGRSLSSIVERGGFDAKVLSDSFRHLAIEMLSRKGWAHGDLSADNLIVDDHNQMHYIDCDSNFVEALRGKRSVDLGTPAFQSPLRQSFYFKERVDHFSIALIYVALRAMSYDAGIYKGANISDGLVIDASQISIKGCKVLDDVRELLARSGDMVAYRLARILSYRPLYIDSLLEMLQFASDIDEGHCDLSGEELSSFSNGLAWGYCDGEGNEKIPLLFDEAFEFRGEETLVKIASRWLYIDRRARIVAERDL